MKKLGKFIFGTLSLAALAGGVFYFLKNVADKSATDDFEDFDDDFEDDFEDDFDSFEAAEKPAKGDNSREYVTLHMSPNAEDIDESATELETNRVAAQEEVTSEAPTIATEEEDEQ